MAGYVAAREAGGLSDRPAARLQLIDEFLPKLEEWMEHSRGKVRADKAHEKLLALGYAGSERTTRRAVAAARREFQVGRVRVHRPWVTEPGMWLRDFKQDQQPGLSTDRGLAGWAGNDIMYGGRGPDEIYGGSGIDTSPARSTPGCNR